MERLPVVERIDGDGGDAGRVGESAFRQLPAAGRERRPARSRGEASSRCVVEANVRPVVQLDRRNSSGLEARTTGRRRRRRSDRGTPARPRVRTTKRPSGETGFPKSGSASLGGPEQYGLRRRSEGPERRTRARPAPGSCRRQTSFACRPGRSASPNSPAMLVRSSTVSGCSGTGRTGARAAGGRRGDREDPFAVR